MAKKSARPTGAPKQASTSRKSATKAKVAAKTTSAANKKTTTGKESAPQKKAVPKKTTAKQSAAKPSGKTNAKRTAKKTPVRSKPMKTAKATAARAKTAARAATRRTAAEKTSGTTAQAQNVDSYLSTLNGWRKECVANLRKMIRKAAPEASEKVKWSQPVYEHHGPLAWIKAHARHVNLGFWRGVELPDPRKLLSGTGQKMRHIKLSSLKEAGKKELHELVRVAAKLNELKGRPARSAKTKAKHK